MTIREDQQQFAVMAEINRQLRLLMLLVLDAQPDAICADNTCQMGPVPHMANDNYDHPVRLLAA